MSSSGPFLTKQDFDTRTWLKKLSFRNLDMWNKEVNMIHDPAHPYLPVTLQTAIQIQFSHSTFQHNNIIVQTASLIVYLTGQESRQEDVVCMEFYIQNNTRQQLVTKYCDFFNTRWLLPGLMLLQVTGWRHRSRDTSSFKGFPFSSSPVFDDIALMRLIIMITFLWKVQK